MWEHWNPTKKEIEEWSDLKLHKFTVQESRNRRVSEEDWLDRYIFTDIHEIFFVSFPIELYEWIARLADSVGRCRLDHPIMWTPELVRRLEAIEDKIAHAVDHWLDRVIGGFIIEFAIDTTVSYSEAKRWFLQGPRGRYIKSLNTGIKMSLCDKQIMRVY